MRPSQGSTRSFTAKPYFVGGNNVNRFEIISFETHGILKIMDFFLKKSPLFSIIIIIIKEILFLSQNGSIK